MHRLLVFALIFPALLRADDGGKAKEEMVELKKFAPRIVIELRYATWHNLAKRSVYPKNARAFLRKGVAQRLLDAQDWLDTHAPKGTRLKIWDAWRPAWAQKQLWSVLPNREYLGDPNDGGSLHSWGACVDATLVDVTGKDLKMPTDFDEIGPKSKTYYKGSDEVVKKNLYYLQASLSKAGFLVVRDEWWHFCARDWKEYAAIDLSISGDAVPE
jgi:D-alanyl-D-alanine dipeptidase